ncbi:hypothetical protein GVY41_15215 [Frigidibacter albus]|uniref:Uncharacterized protein n=1 Tax=Frigidibacter albus TaxID=1465486 RepID=A0A6L8VMC8_9RHOB|nr:hypothetical protein [Frigidibacter albus]MZQ90529.1 hypothetical protein [Frigidibacter albus]NBE32351.1 hypothetical protein [Frigidibacter albus]GGH59310.1 hypothetical protein GCM10011341_30480 [Frigidibacter albus]
MTETYSQEVVAAAMQPLAEFDVPPALQASIERHGQALLTLAVSLARAGLPEPEIRTIVDQACASYRDELIAAILALREHDEE